MSDRPVDAPLWIRSLAPIGAFVVALLGYQLVLRRDPGAASALTVLLSYLVIGMPFMALALLREPARPLLPLRVALNVAIVFAVGIALSMPIPPRRETLGSLFVCALVVAISVSIQILMRERQRLAFSMLIALAAVGAYLGYAGVAYAMSPTYGAVVKGSFGGIAFLGAACLAALWYGRPLGQRPVEHTRLAL